VKSKNRSYQATEVERLRSEHKNEVAVSPPPENLKAAQWHLALNLPVRAQVKTSFVESEVQAVERVPSEGRGMPAKFIPIRFIFTNKLSDDDKLLLAFDAFVFSEATGQEVNLGKIIHGDYHGEVKVKVAALAGEVRKRVGGIATLLSSPTPPALVLNRHCGECEFQARCRRKALETDDLSLLSGMSEMERKKFHSKGSHSPRFGTSLEELLRKKASVNIWFC
jgi:predicted RecB family nuclease